MTVEKDQTIGIALLGCGVVGGGVLRILREQADLVAQRTHVRFEVRHVVCRDPAKHADVANGYPLHTDLEKAVNDPQVQIVVELMGGHEPARKSIARAIEQGKHIVTANKSLLAVHGPELFALARKKDVALAFEASCAGGIPIIDILTRGLLANRIDALIGIVNGTCNFILTQMMNNGWSYDAALKEAQRLGFAEADPAMDVSGRDSAQKLAILSSLAFNALVREEDVALTGIDTLQTEDIKHAKQLGYVIKLLAFAERVGQQLSVRCQPTLVHRGDLFADVAGSFNAVGIYGSAVGHQFFYGRGAGQMPTASAVVADLINIGIGATTRAFSRLNLLPDALHRAQILPAGERVSRYYLRATCLDQPGVLAQITQALSRNNISVSSVHQPESEVGQPSVPLILTTHKARLADMIAALAEIDGLPTIADKTTCLPIIDQPKEFAGS